MFNKATYIGVIALMLWAFTLPFAKQCSDHIGPYTTVAITYLCSGVIGILFAVFIHKKNPLRCEIIRTQLFAVRVVMYLAYFLFLYSAIGVVHLGNYPIVILLNYLWPSFTLLFSIILFNQKVKRNVFVFGTALIVAGICTEVLGTQILGTAKSLSLQIIPYVLALLAAFTWGLYSALNRKWRDAGTNGEEIPALMLSIGIFFSFISFFSKEKLEFEFDIVLPLAYLCIVPFIANVCWDIGTRKGNLNSLSLLADFIPWVSLTVTALYFKIPIGFSTWLAAVLIVIGAIISRCSFRKSAGELMQSEETILKV